MTIEPLETTRLVLRSLHPNDKDAMRLLRSNDRVNQYLDRAKIDSQEESIAFIKKILKGVDQDKWYYWAICFEELNQLIGTVCLWDFSEDRKQAELGFEMLPAYYGQGIMTEVLQSIIPFAFQTIKLKTLYAYTHVDNKKSIALLKKNKFIQKIIEQHPNHTGTGYNAVALYQLMA